MGKKGRGFKTEEYRTSYRKVHNYYTETSDILLEAPKGYETLGGIKKGFVNDKLAFICVVEGNLTAPTTLIQLIVECETLEQLNTVKQHYTEKPEYIDCTYHVNYTWLNDIPNDVLDNWLAY